MTVKSSAPVIIFTGGHHTGSLEVAKKMLNRGVTVVWFGHRRSMWGDKADSAEYTEVTSAGISFINLQAGKFHRTYHPLKLIRLPWGFIQAFYHLVRLKITHGNNLKGVVTFGGYLSVPVAVGAWILSLPIIAHEQTLVSGLANQLVSWLAAVIAVSWPESFKEFPPSKVFYTGSLIRPAIVSALSTPTAPDGKPVLYITGGKQGAHRINLAIFSTLSVLLPSFQVIHQTGSSTIYKDFDHARQIRADLPESLRSDYLPLDYLPADQVARFLAQAEVVISRSGAHIIAELALLGKKSVLIPLPGSSHQEQEKNAEYLADRHMAVILPQHRLTSENLLAALDQAKKLKPRKFHLPTDGVDNLVKLITDRLL